MDSCSGAARAVPRLVVAILHCFLDRYRDLIDLSKLATGPMFYIGPTVGAKCSVRLTWDVFVRDLNRRLGTPSHWLPVDSCKEGQTLAAVCTPTLKSASKKHQNYAPPYRSTACGTLKEVKEKLCLVYIFSFWQRSFPSPLYVTSRIEPATREILENLPKVRTPFPTSQALFKLP